VVDYTKGDPVAAILDLTHGEGVDCAIEALGSDLTFQQAVKVTKAGGTISNIGYHGEGEFVHSPGWNGVSGWPEIPLKRAFAPAAACA